MFPPLEQKLHPCPSLPFGPKYPDPHRLHPLFPLPCHPPLGYAQSFPFFSPWFQSPKSRPWLLIFSPPLWCLSGFCKRTSSCPVPPNYPGSDCSTYQGGWNGSRQSAHKVCLGKALVDMDGLYRKHCTSPEVSLETAVSGLFCSLIFSTWIISCLPSNFAGTIEVVLLLASLLHPPALSLVDAGLSTSYDGASLVVPQIGNTFHTRFLP